MEYMDACHNKQGKNAKRQTKHDDKPMHNLRNCSPCGTLGTLCFPTQRTPLQRTLHIYRKRILYIYIYIYITSIRTSANTKESSVDTTYKHALSLSLSVLTSFKVRVCRTVVRFYLFGFDWRIKVPSFTLQISHWIAFYKFCSDEIEDY